MIAALLVLVVVLALCWAAGRDIIEDMERWLDQRRKR